MFVCCITCFLTANQVLYRFYWQVAGWLHKNMVLRLEVEASECDCSLAFILCSSIARFKFGFLCARMQLVSASSACIKRKNSTVINNAVCNALCLIYFVFFYGPIWWVCVWHEHCTDYSCSSVGGMFTLRWLSLVAVVSARFAILILPVCWVYILGQSLYIQLLSCRYLMIQILVFWSAPALENQTECCSTEVYPTIFRVMVFFWKLHARAGQLLCLQCIRFLHSLWTNWFMFIFLVPINIRNRRKVYNFDISDLSILRSKVQFLRRSRRVRNTAAAPRLHLGCLQQRSRRRSINSWYRFEIFFIQILKFLCSLWINIMDYFMSFG